MNQVLGKVQLVPRATLSKLSDVCDLFAGKQAEMYLGHVSSCKRKKEMSDMQIVGGNRKHLIKITHI
jgi:hypothetical protein